MSTNPSGFMSDLAYGLRQIQRNPSLTVLCVVVLAIGTGAATAVFAVLYAVLLKPLSYREANRLVYVHNEFPSSQLGHTLASAPDYADLTAHREIFSETAAYYFNDFTMSSVSGLDYAQHVDVVNASASLFSMLGTPAHLGRAFLSEEDRFGAPKAVLLSDPFWRSRFGADSKIVGRTIQLDAVPYQIIGVMPADFNFPYPATQMWIPLALRPEAYTAGRGGKYLNMLGRLAPGVTFESANAMLATVSHHLAAQYPDEYPEATGWHFSMEPMLAERTKDVRKWVLLAFGAVLCVLLIACTNVSGLLLVRAAVRSRELAVRSALGASPGRLARQILTETALFVVMGCAAGVGLAIALVHLINAYGPSRGRCRLPSDCASFPHFSPVFFPRSCPHALPSNRLLERAPVGPRPGKRVGAEFSSLGKSPSLSGYCLPPPRLAEASRNCSKSLLVFPRTGCGRRTSSSRRRVTPPALRMRLFSETWLTASLPSRASNQLPLTSLCRSAAAASPRICIFRGGRNCPSGPRRVLTRFFRIISRP